MGAIDRRGEDVTRMDARELKALQLVWSLLGAMEHSSGQALEKRLRRAKAWNAWRLAAVWLKRALQLMVGKTVTLDQQLLCEHVLKHGTIDITIRASQDKDICAVPAAALEDVVNAAMSAQCAICLKEDRDVRRCRLRRSLLKVAPPQTMETAGCVYRDAVLASKDGQYIEV